MAESERRAIVVRATYGLGPDIDFSDGRPILFQFVRGIRATLLPPAAPYDRGVEAQIETAAPLDVLAALEDLAAGFAPLGSDLKHPDVLHRNEWDGEPLVGPDRRIRGRHVFPFGALPPRVQAFSDEVSSDLGEIAGSTARLVRWRTGIDAPHRALVNSRSSEWSTDRASWHSLPRGIYATVRAVRKAKISDDIRRGIESLHPSDEPLAHELRLEAEANLTSNPRSSLILAVTSLETGVKQYIASTVQHAEWLAFELPSPPILKVLVNYLPTLPSVIGSPIAAPPARMRRSIARAVEERNRLAHRGNPDWSTAQQTEFLAVLYDLLYLFDYHTGQEWALSLVSDQSQEDFGLRVAG